MKRWRVQIGVSAMGLVGEERFLSVQDGLCANHHAELKQKERADVAGILFQYAQDFQTAQGINYSLRSLYWLIGQKPRLLSSRHGPRLHQQLASAHTARHRRRAKVWHHLHPRSARARPNPETVMTRTEFCR